MIQRTKIALIMPYFGNFPNYFAFMGMFCIQKQGY